MDPRMMDPRLSMDPRLAMDPRMDPRLLELDQEARVEAKGAAEGSRLLLDPKPSSPEFKAKQEGKFEGKEVRMEPAGREAPKATREPSRDRAGGAGGERGGNGGGVAGGGGGGGGGGDLRERLERLEARLGRYEPDGGREKFVERYVEHVSREREHSARDREQER